MQIKTSIAIEEMIIFLEKLLRSLEQIREADITVHKSDILGKSAEEIGLLVKRKLSEQEKNENESNTI